jgi:hypothetical protein
MNIKSTLAAAMALGLGLTTAAIGAPKSSSSPGNSSFGRNQRTDLQTGPCNSTYGRTTAANARLRSSDDLDDDNNDDVVKPKKTKKAKHTWSSYPGNSEFGRNQRVNHLKGSGNNAHGKTVSANAKAKHNKNR